MKHKLRFHSATNCGPCTGISRWIWKSCEVQQVRQTACQFLPSLKPQNLRAATCSSDLSLICTLLQTLIWISHPFHFLEKSMSAPPYRVNSQSFMQCYQDSTKQHPLTLQTPRIIDEAPWTSKWAAPGMTEAMRLCFWAAQASTKAESLLPLQVHAALTYLYQLLQGWESYTRWPQSGCSSHLLLVFHAVLGSWLPFQNRPQTSGESEHVGGQRSSERTKSYW